MKLLICIFERPSGGRFTASAKLKSESPDHIANAKAQFVARHRNARLIETKIGDSTAVRKASSRNTTVKPLDDAPPAGDAPELKVGIQHADAVGGEEVVGPLVQNGDGDDELPKDPFADVEDEDKPSKRRGKK